MLTPDLLPFRWSGAASAAVLWLSSLVGASPVYGQGPARGPLAFAERNPLYELFYVPHAAPADLVARGRTQMDVGVAYSNIFERSVTPTHFQLFDTERMSTTVTLRHGVTERWVVGGRLTVHTDWGGFLDSFIEGVHSTFNVSNGDRELVDQGLYSLLLREREGVVLMDVARRTFAPADLHVFGQARLSGGPEASSALALQVMAKLPTGVEEANTGGADVAIELRGRRSSEPWHLHGMFGATTLNPPAALEALTHRVAALFGVGVERAMSPGLSLVLQAQSSTRYLSGIGEDELDDFPLLIGFGVTGGGDLWQWEAGFVEDIPPNSPSVDFTVHFQLSRTWE